MVLSLYNPPLSVKFDVCPRTMEGTMEGTMEMTMEIYTFSIAHEHVLVDKHDSPAAPWHQKLSRTCMLPYI